MIAEIWQRLARGELLDRAGLPKLHDRIDARNLNVPEPYAIKRERLARFDVTHLSGFTTVRGANWQSIDFSNSKLPSIRLFDCQIEDCIFDRCRLPDLRVWGTTFAKVSFRFADLRDAALGGIAGYGLNIFRDVDFTGADLRGSAHFAAQFERCKFIHTKLDKLDFQSSNFTDCVFEGELREVQFFRTGFKAEQFPPNEMKRVDFRRAKLRWSEFRGLDLDDVFFPEDEDHLIIRNYPAALDALLGYFGSRTDLPSQRLHAVFEIHRKWLGPRQRVGILNKHDVMEMAGEDGLRTVIAIIDSVSPSEPYSTRKK
jgi:uncharacterized protein YjbI with pentapeptide repeats